MALVVAAAVTIALLAAPDTVLGDTDHTAVVAATRDGNDFYSLLAGIVPAGAFAGRLIPLPTLALVECAAGTLGMTILLCGMLAALLLVGWDRLGDVFADATGQTLGVLMLLAGVTGSALLVMAEPHAGWSALLGGWSLLLRRRDRWIEAAALACAAATIDPAAVVLPVAMAMTAWRDGARREGAGWLLVVAVAATTWASHRIALAKLGLDAIGAGTTPASFDFAAAAFVPGAPGWLGSALLVFALAGWDAVRGDLARRVALVAIGGLAIGVLPGMQSAAVLALPLLPLGLVFAVEAGATLVPAAANRRRITVTRMTR